MIVISNIYSHFKKLIIGGIAALCAAIVLIAGYRYFDQKYKNTAIKSDISTSVVNDAIPDNSQNANYAIEIPETDKDTAEEIVDETPADEEIIKEDINGIDILVSKLRPIPEDRIFILEYVVPGKRCDQRAVQPMKDMLEAAENEEIKLIISSAYRDNRRQEELFDQKIKKYMKEIILKKRKMNMRKKKKKIIRKTKIIKRTII